MPFTFGDESFNTGDSTGVSCMIVKGDLPIQIKWTLNNEPIISGENGITINKLSAKSSVLNIGSVEKEHRGIIKCIAENLAGSDAYASELSVNGTNQQRTLFIIIDDAMRFVQSFLCFFVLSFCFVPTNFSYPIIEHSHTSNS